MLAKVIAASSARSPLEFVYACVPWKNAKLTDMFSLTGEKNARSPACPGTCTCVAQDPSSHDQASVQKQFEQQAPGASRTCCALQAYKLSQ